MALVTLRLGLKKSSGNSRNVFSKIINAKVFDVRVASISGSTFRTEPAEPKPRPWNYKRWGYTNAHCFIDDTVKRFDENTKIITVEGPPACGKTAFAKALAEDLGMLYLPMVTSDYMYINHYGFDFRVHDKDLPYYGQSMDEMKFIKDPRQENAPQLPLSLYVLKYSQYIDALMHLFNTGQGVVIERSVYTDEAFIDALTQVGYLLKEEKSGYYKLKANGIGDLRRPHLAIYLDASVDTVLKNLKKRGLGEEKTYHGDFLAALEETHKRKTLVELEKHAELLCYDWNEPGDPLVVVEDIERIDFNRFGKHDEKQKDWRLPYEIDYSECRWFYTNRKDYIMANFNMELFDCPRLYMPGDEYAEYRHLSENFPGNFMHPGFNAALGDKVAFKFGKDIGRLPDVVTDALLKNDSFKGQLNLPTPPPPKDINWFVRPLLH